MVTVYTQAGEEVIVDAIEAQTACYVGWGTGDPTPAKGSTDLAIPATEARVVGTESQPSADINQWVAEITADGTKTITEAGLFDAAGSGSPPSGGNMIIISEFTGIALGAGDKIQFTITLEQT